MKRSLAFILTLMLLIGLVLPMNGFATEITRVTESIESTKAAANNEIVWEQGTILAASGLEKDYPIVIRTADYLRISDYVGLTLNADHYITYFVYDANYNYLGNGKADLTANFLLSGQGISTHEMLLRYPEGEYFKIALYRGKEDIMTPEMLGGAGVRFLAADHDPVFWEMGSIYAKNGEAFVREQVIRSVNYLPIEDYAGVTVANGYAISFLAYDENLNYLGNGNPAKTGYFIPGTVAMQDILDQYPNTKYVRLLFREDPIADFTMDAVEQSQIHVYSAGETLPEPALKQSIYMNIKKCQDGAIYNGNAFVFDAKGNCVVYRLSEKKQIATFTLDKVDVLNPHANSVCFGSTYYAQGDKYPLLYVNIYNNYANAADKKEGICCVYRLTETDGVFSTELVQVIKIGFVNDTTLWKSPEGNDDRSYGNFVVDTDNNKLYAFVRRWGPKEMRFFQFDLPGLEEGIENTAYSCNVVTLSVEDIEHQFTTEEFDVIQGCCYSSGKIIALSGVPYSPYNAEPAIRFVDLKTGEVETFWLDDYAVTDEPEMVSVDPETGMMYYAAIDGKLRVFKFANMHFHGYVASVTPPTCTEQGYTTHTCSCGDSYVDSYVAALGHHYKNGICSVCSAKHPNLASYEGKVISILSASTSTFAGYIPVADGFNLEHRPRYPQDNLLTDVNETWWMQVINELHAKLGINDSWAGSTVSNFRDTNSGDLGPDAAMASLTRIQNLGANGTPDVILFYGGGNDMGRGVTMGSFDPTTAPTEVDLTATKWDSFADAYVAAIMRLQYFYPDAEIVVIMSHEMPSYVTAAKLNQYGPVMKSICDHYGVKYVDLRDCGITFDMLPDNIHPNAEGMDYITADVLDTLLNRVDLESGENVVYPVTHNLINAGTSRHYYKGVSAGESFVEAVSGENVTVTVTMGGVDMTAQVYANGTISIPSVTGELVITIKGAFNADGHLQRLPENICAGTNLWTALTPENIYYTATGWGNTSAETTWSITFPVMPGDRIWATSLGAAPANGSTANGVRITWFDENGMMATLDRNIVYQEFAQYGYITVPEGAVALNLPMTNNQSTYSVYILSRDHSYENGVCFICGHTVDIPIPPQSGDINGDGQITITDFMQMKAHLLQASILPDVSAADLNGDSAITLTDFVRMKSLLLHPEAVQEAKDAYTAYLRETDGTAQAYMLYSAEGRWVALHNGAAVGVYESDEDAVGALVDGPQNYRALRFLTENIYHVLDLSDYIGKQIACIGDSVTSGVGANPNPNYEKNLGSMLNSATVNLGTSGTSLCAGGSRTCQFAKFNETSLQGAEIVTIYLGINDWAAAGNANNQPFYALGTPDGTDTSTIYGAMKMWCNKIVELKNTEQYKDTIFFFITPHLTSWNNSVTSSKNWDQNKRNIHGYTQKDMSEAIKTVCNEYGIPVIDMYDFTVKLYNQNPAKYEQEYSGDGVHPTAGCHKLMAEYILFEFAKQ